MSSPAPLNRSKRKRTAQACTNHLETQQKKFIVNQHFTVPWRFEEAGLKVQVRVWIPIGQAKHRIKTSYIRIEGKVFNEEFMFRSLAKFKTFLRARTYPLVFDVTEYIQRQRRKICGTSTGTDNYKNQYAQTPQAVYDCIARDLGLQLADLDPCPPNPDFDGLSDDFRWKAQPDQVVYVNPPFCESKEWVAKALREMQAGSCQKCIFLLPARMNAPWFGQVAKHCQKMHIPKSVTFKGYDQPYPWGVYLAELTKHETPDFTVQCIDRHLK
jgi:hypothetical protein